MWKGRVLDNLQNPGQCQQSDGRVLCCGVMLFICRPSLHRCCFRLHLLWVTPRACSPQDENLTLEFLSQPPWHELEELISQAEDGTACWDKLVLPYSQHAVKKDAVLDLLICQALLRRQQNPVRDGMGSEPRAFSYAAGSVSRSENGAFWRSEELGWDARLGHVPNINLKLQQGSAREGREVGRGRGWGTGDLPSCVLGRGRDTRLYNVCIRRDCRREIREESRAHWFWGAKGWGLRAGCRVRLCWQFCWGLAALSGF